jgi:uncharacterized protein (DUF433 family)
MTTVTLDKPRLGEGVYAFSEAAQIIRSKSPGVTTRQLRYWMTSGLTPATHVVDGQEVLTFDDLISLEVVRRLRTEGASLQSVRAVEAVLRHEYNMRRPFAYEVFFTDGANVWAEVVGEKGRIVIELAGRRRNQYAWRDAIATFAEDIRFEGEAMHATRWRLSEWVVVNPKMQFGQPVLANTRVPMSTIAANLEVGTPEQVADWYGLGVKQVVGVRDYLELA